MRSCWHANPDDRPHFSDLKETFKDILFTMTRNDVQSGNGNDTANYTPGYLQMVRPPTIEDLLIPEGPTNRRTPPHPLPPSEYVNNASSFPPPAPPRKPAVPKKSKNVKNKPVPRLPYDDGYLEATNAD